MPNVSLNDPISPTQEEMELAKVSSRQLASCPHEDLRVQIGDTNEVIVLPGAAVRILNDTLAAMAEGDAVAMIPIRAELTTQQAADLLGVSRPFLVRQMEEGVIPYRKVGTHRRVLFSELMRYRRSAAEQCTRNLEELTALGQEMDMGY